MSGASPGAGAPSPGRPRNWTQLARELGRSKSYISKVRKKDWWPADLRPYEVDRARQVLQQHAPAKETSPPLLGDPPPEERGEDLGSRADVESLEKLLDAKDLDATRFAAEVVRFAGQRVVAQARLGKLAASDMRALKQSMTELRQAEREGLEQAERRGSLVPRAASVEVAAAIGRSLVDGLSALETLFASQVLQWLDDPGFRRLGEQAQSEAVRTWVERRVRDFRSLVAEQLEELLDRAVDEHRRSERGRQAP